MYRTATYWPPKSWDESESSGRQNIAVRVQAIWTQEGSGEIEVYLLGEVAEGGYLYDGISNVSDPRKQEGARKIDLYLQHPDLRSLKMVRKAILSRDVVAAAKAA